MDWLFNPNAIFLRNVRICFQFLYRKLVYHQLRTSINYEIRGRPSKKRCAIEGDMCPTSEWCKEKLKSIIHTEETRRERDTCTPMFIAALFIIENISWVDSSFVYWERNIVHLPVDFFPIFFNCYLYYFCR